MTSVLLDECLVDTQDMYTRIAETFNLFLSHHFSNNNSFKFSRSFISGAPPSLLSSEYLSLM